MGGDCCQKLLPRRGIALLSGAQQIFGSVLPSRRLELLRLLDTLESEPFPAVYRPQSQARFDEMTLVVRTAKRSRSSGRALFVVIGSCPSVPSPSTSTVWAFQVSRSRGGRYACLQMRAILNGDTLFRDPHRGGI